MTPPAPAHPAADAPRSSGTTSRRSGALLLACALSSTLALLWVAGPLFDGDLWWHVRLGQEILDRHSVSGTGLGWSLTPPVDGSWTTTQWLSEILMATTYKVGGWAALGWLRLLGEVALLASLAWATLRKRSLEAATAPFCLAVLSSAIFVQDRPQQMTYILCPLVGWAVARFLAGGDLPHPVIVIVGVFVWAQFHPGWVIVPGLLAVLLLGAVLDDGVDVISTPRVRRGLWLFPATAVAGCLTPAGPQGLLAGSRIGAAARETITEWQPAGFDNIGPVLLVVMVALLVLSWALHDPRPSRSELVLVAALLAFGVMAFRNVVPAILLLAPIVASRLDRARSRRAERTAGPRSASKGWQITSAFVLVLGLAGAVLIQASADPFSGNKAPTRILAEVQHRAPARVVTTYNLGGFFAGLGGPGVVVGIDGRTDYYGADYIRQYTDMVAAKPGWQDLFETLDPDVVVLERTDALVGALETEGWTQVLTEKDFVMLEKGTSA